MIWLKRISCELGLQVENPVSILTDSQSCISMIKNQKFSNRSKHIDTKYHFIQDHVMSEEINLKFCPTEFNIADMLTKPLGSIKISQLSKMGKLENTI
jgi:hypothetical protein